MIVFKKLRFKNFLSFGDHFVEFDFTSSKRVLIVGENGSGKSTFIDALIFALYGKPFRKITKQNIMNSINQGKTLVEVEFVGGGNEYMVRRGIKPNVFEIYKNGVLINQNAAAKDYQQMLEEDILKINQQAFTQIAVLGKATYVPFMQLPLGKRREVVEEFLSLSVFADMKDILSMRIKGCKEDKQELETKLVANESELAATKQHLQSVKTNQKQKVEEYKEMLAEKRAEFQKLVDTALQLKEKMLSGDFADELYRVRDKLNMAKEGRVTTEFEIEQIMEFFSFVSGSDVCPTCEQPLELSEDDPILVSKRKQLEELKERIALFESDIEATAALLETIEERHRKQEKQKIVIGEYKKRAIALKSDISLLESRVKSAESSTDEQESIESKLASLIEQNKKIKRELDDVTQDLNEYLVIQEMLKDEGVKSLIVKKYLPMFNHSVNKYLSLFGVHITFSLDEKFNETILARHKDKYGYYSFSEGEKLRIDLSILLAWRDMAKQKSGWDTNLMIMDEIFDSSLDQGGVDAFIDVIMSLDTLNIFIISHTPSKLMDRFPKQIEVVKQGNFSSIKHDEV